MLSNNKPSKIHDYIGHNLNHNSIITVGYSPYANNQVKNLQKNGISDQAVRRVYEEGISIDGVDSLDLDDAIWCEKTHFGYTVFVHISDVTEAILPYSPLDLEALKRTTSVYRASGVINMFPEYLSQNIMSLNEDGTKLTLTMKIELNYNGDIINFGVYESIFKNLKRYNYEDFMDDFLNPDTVNYNTLQIMHELAAKRRTIRRTSGAMQNYDESDRDIFIGEKEEKQNQIHKYIPKIIIEEFMILANIAAASIGVQNTYNTIFRNHFSVDEQALYANHMKMHKGLALDRYTHFTSPIRRYGDIIVHRILKIVHLRGEESPYSKDDIQDIANHINQVKTVIKTIGSTIDLEYKGAIKVAKLKDRNPNRELTTSDFTQDIREKLGKKQRLPSLIKQEIINDILSGDKGTWAWAIGVFLVAGDSDIKQAIKQAILIDKKFSARPLFSLLKNTKILNTDDNYLFDIRENSNGNRYYIETYFRGELLFTKSINIGKFDEKEAQSKVMYQTVEAIINHFVN